MSDKELIAKAMEAKKHSYSPYSNFKVGACLLCSNGSVYTGCNIENSAYGSSCCAERTAIFKAVSDGNTNFVKIAIAVDGNDYGFPCGECRQVIAEFAHNLEVIMANENGEYIKEDISKLLPYNFKL